MGKLEAYGTGYRVFPEKQTSSQPFTDNKVHAKVTLAYAIPAGLTGTVFVKWFDPDNPLAVDKNDPEGDNQNRPNDNDGDFYDGHTAKLVFDGSKPQAIQ